MISPIIFVPPSDFYPRPRVEGDAQLNSPILLKYTISTHALA